MSSTFMDAALQKFQAHADKALAGPMEQYMKNHFPFLGIKSPLRKELSKQLFREQGVPDRWEEVVLQLFIQKAIGWSLREYAKTNPEAVRDFVEKTPLASLSKREALKHLA